ncbi:MAG: DNA-processing protein DprA [Oscillospiraceae bacterium]|jgi:DNA processing protein|nr:DNA-processing protein DprA [Oscillospiraceae bacterium]
MSTLKYYVWLSAAEGIGAATAVKLIRHFGTAERVFFADAGEYKKVSGITPSEMAALANKDLSHPSGILARCTELGQRIVTIQDAEYPERLRNIYDPPLVLYVKGRLPAIDEEAAIAIVGTRTCTPYGLKTAEKCGYTLARRGLLVVTGLAKGVDSAAALGALRGGGGVIGVLGCGIDVIYPPTNKELYEDVSGVGALISEYPPGTDAAGRHFPARNRIISGLSVGVAVIEAPLRSGALITASRALEQGRDVFAVPGNVDSFASAGANKLLRDGAIPMTSPEDIVNEYSALFPLKINAGKVSTAPLDKKREKKLMEKHSTSQKRLDSAAGNEYIDAERDVDGNLSETTEADAAAAREAEAEKIAISLTGAEKAVYDALRRLARPGEAAHIDDIIASAEITAAEALGAVTMLELDGSISSLGGGFYTA